MAGPLSQVPAVPWWSKLKRLGVYVQGRQRLPLPLMEGEGWLGVQVGLWGPGGRRKRSRRRRRWGRRSRVWQLDWGWRVQCEGKVRAGTEAPWWLVEKTQTAKASAAKSPRWNGLEREKQKEKTKTDKCLRHYWIYMEICNAVLHDTNIKIMLVNIAILSHCTSLL